MECNGFGLILSTRLCYPVDLVLGRRLRRPRSRDVGGLRWAQSRSGRVGRRLAVVRDRDVRAPDEDLVVLVGVPAVREDRVRRGLGRLGDLEPARKLYIAETVARSTPSSCPKLFPVSFPADAGFNL